LKNLNNLDFTPIYFVHGRYSRNGTSQKHTIPVSTHMIVRLDIESSSIWPRSFPEVRQWQNA